MTGAVDAKALEAALSTVMAIKPLDCEWADFIRLDAEDADALGVALLAKVQTGEVRYYGYSDIRADEHEDAVRAFLALIINHAVPAYLAALPPEADAALKAEIERLKGLAYDLDHDMQTLIPWRDRHTEMTEEYQHELKRREAAEREVAELRAREARYREALEPFAADRFNDWCPDEAPAWYESVDGFDAPSSITVGDFRRARALDSREDGRG